jgi:hypothetical protein
MRIKEIEHVQLAMPPGMESEARTFYEGVRGIFGETRWLLVCSGRTKNSLGRRE